ncbi:hypothetical protein FDP41_000471 [Naegleria fowleri]|uniref:Guanine nucleotide-binding protein subunit beta-like protein n=1 Tax=Naegleria fowleri TaxID=5763 RepID=A0A6A5CBZ0_NAEFO|nr:uncharacterized protein FDP41_000471 [Naegleria fowleri]KAF0984572.1 hypothetical protein FDP41_000471 [Naegleria fowleri]
MSIPLHQVGLGATTDAVPPHSEPSSSSYKQHINLYSLSILTKQKVILGDLDVSALHHVIDPGHIHANRLASSYSSLYFINHKKLYKINYELPKSENILWRPTKNTKLPYPIPLADINIQVIYDAGKSDFQDIEIHKNRIGVCDDMGNVYIFDNQHDDNHDDDDTQDKTHSKKKRKIDESSIIQLSYDSPSSSEMHIRGHSSVKFHPTDDSIIIRSKFENKNVTIYDVNRNSAIFNIHTMQNPTKLKPFIIEQSNTPLLAIGEYNNVSIWDFRSNKVVNRLTRTRGIVYDMEVTSSGSNGKHKSSNLLGVVGSDRTVYVYDTLKWSPIHKWQNCLKYAPSYLSFSNVNKELCYVAGFDNSEFKCGNFVDQKQQRHGRGHGLYADHRWIGMTKPLNAFSSGDGSGGSDGQSEFNSMMTTTANDTIVGMSMNGTLYVIEHPYKMAPMSGLQQSDHDDDLTDREAIRDDDLMDD